MVVLGVVTDAGVGWGGRGRGRGEHGHGGFDRGGRLDFRDEFEKFKLEIRNLITTQREG